MIDLFAGGGGFSLGAHWAGFDVAAAVDIDPILTSSFKHNFPGTPLFNLDISSLKGAELHKLAGGQVDGVIGGPPCQGFSTIGRRLPGDPRRSLVLDFFRLVSEVEPRFFLMENVRGLGHDGNRQLLADGLKLVSSRFDILGPEVLDAADFGAATRRSRLFVAGMRKDAANPLTRGEIIARRRRPQTVRAAIWDLLSATEVGENEGFDVWRHGSGRATAYAQRMRSANRLFTGHRSTQHSKKVLTRFESVPEGGIDPVGRHPRLGWDGQCPTLRAGTGSDKGSYQSVRPIHPNLPRVITVREAARLQGFPDDFRFHPTTWHSFRMIGNSVSPIIAEAVLAAIHAKLGVDQGVLTAAE